MNFPLQLFIFAMKCECRLRVEKGISLSPTRICLIESDAGRIGELLKTAWNSLIAKLTVELYL